MGHQASSWVWIKIDISKGIQKTIVKRILLWKPSWKACSLDFIGHYLAILLAAAWSSRQIIIASIDRPPLQDTRISWGTSKRRLRWGWWYNHNPPLWAHRVGWPLNQLTTSSMMIHQFPGGVTRLRHFTLRQERYPMISPKKLTRYRF